MPAGSSPLVGSSRIRSSGSASRQRAIPAAGACPSSTDFTRSSARAPSPTRASAGPIRSCASGSRHAAAMRRFSRPVRCPWKRGSSTIAPTRAQRLRALLRHRHAEQLHSARADGVSPSSARISVVLPAPLGPRNPYATAARAPADRRCRARPGRRSAWSALRCAGPARRRPGCSVAWPRRSGEDLAHPVESRVRGQDAAPGLTYTVFCCVKNSRAAAPCSRGPYE